MEIQLDFWNLVLISYCVICYVVYAVAARHIADRTDDMDRGFWTAIFFFAPVFVGVTIIVFAIGFAVSKFSDILIPRVKK